MKRKYYLYLKNKRIEVSEELYKAYWKETNRENYLKQVEKKQHLFLFSSLDDNGHFEENIEDEEVNVEKIVETRMMIEALRKALSELNAEEREIIELLYFKNKTLRSVAKHKNITHSAIIKRRNKILEKLKKFLEKF